MPEEKTYLSSRFHHDLAHHMLMIVLAAKRDLAGITELAGPIGGECERNALAVLGEHGSG